MSWLKRKWRSVSFRSGLGASLVVGLIVSLALFLLLAAVFVSVLVAGSSIQTSVMNRLEDQLEIGIAPEEVSIENAGDIFLDEAFWAVTLSDQGNAGSVVSRSGGFDEALLALPFDDLSVGINLELTADFDRAGTKSHDGGQWLVIEDIVDVDGTDYVVVTGARGETSLRSFIWDAFPFIIPVVLVVMTVAGLITSWFTRRALGSVERMRVEVEQITQKSLDRRVPTTGARDRIDKLAETMNDMLERLESSTLQQNRFLADASHELRSPVAGLLAQLDVAAAYPDRADTATLIPKLQSEAQRLQLVLDDLLFLSRSEAQRSQPPAAPRSVAIDRLLDAEVDHQRMVHPTMIVERDGSTDATVVGNERDLQRAVRNLADNACRHAKGQVVLAVSEDTTAVTLTITDDGTGVSADDASKIFDRFVRLDESRARDAGGSGLGLAIVKEIAVAHGGEIELLTTEPAGASFAIRLPIVDLPT